MNRLLTIAVVLLLLVNVTMLIFMLKGRGHHYKGNRGDGPFDEMVKELSMTEQQQSDFKKFKDEHFRSIRPVFDSVKTLKKSLFNLIKDENLNDSLVNHYSSLISEQRAIADKLTINHFHKVRNLLNADQQKKFEDFVQKMIQRGRKDSTGGKKDGRPHQ